MRAQKIGQLKKFLAKFMLKNKPKKNYRMG